MREKLEWVVCAAVAGALTFSGGIAASPPPDLGNILGYEAALEVDAQNVATSLKISLEEAKSRLKVQEHSSPITERLRKQYESRLAGLYIEHEPTHRIVVRLTGHAVIRPEFHHFDGDSLEVAFVPGAAHKLSHLQKRFDKVFGRLTASTPAVQGGYVDERTGEVVIEVLRGESKAKAQAMALRSEIGAPIRVVELPNRTNCSLCMEAVK